MLYRVHLTWVGFELTTLVVRVLETNLYDQVCQLFETGPWFSLGTLSIFKVIGQRSRSMGQIFRRGDTPRFAFPLFFLKN
jgi:hypothetical protein